MQTNNTPGKHERHLYRRQNNPLFPSQLRSHSPQQLAIARKKDQDDLNSFFQAFQQLVEKAVNLEPNTPSETILELKEALDRSYQQSCTLPGETQDIRSAIEKLIASIMQAIWKETTDDAHAKKQLEDEEIARQSHFQLQRNALVADLTAENSPISQEELAPTLLSEPANTLQDALTLFDREQLMVILHDATQWLEKVDPMRENTSAAGNLELIGVYAQKPQATEQ